MNPTQLYNLDADYYAVYDPADNSITVRKRRNKDGSKETCFALKAPIGIWKKIQEVVTRVA